MAVLLSFAVTLGLSLLLSSARGHWQILDIPNDRSLHSTPIPRTGGIAIITGLAAGLVVAWQLNDPLLASWPLLLAAGLLALVALIDDRHDLGAGLRLLIQLGAALLWLLPAAGGNTGMPLLALAVLFIVWMINLYNFMDGMDGFAGGMAVIGFGSFAVLAWQSGDTGLALACGVIVAAAAGFLLLNFPPARLFMGDTGSTVLGLLAAAVILYAHNSGMLPLWLGLLVFSPFIVDASVTLCRRLLRREQVWKAHKSHYYQRLVEAGWGHRRTVLAEYALMLACGGSALVAARLPLALQAVIIAAWAVLYIILMSLIHRAERHQESAQ